MGHKMFQEEGQATEKVDHHTETQDLQLSCFWHCDKAHQAESPAKPSKGVLSTTWYPEPVI